ncbi:MAG TPA: hypothetical protein VF334_10225, partial [Polyangia bacterium]
MRRRGRAIARLLAQSWRRDPGASAPSLPSAAELEDCAALVLEGGAGALAWLRVRGTPLEQAPSAPRFRDEQRAHALAAALQRRHLSAALAALSSIGVTAL